MTAAIESLLGDADAPDGSGESLVELLRAPARHSPTSLAGQLRYVRERWACDPARRTSPRDSLAGRGPPRRGGAGAPPPVRWRRWRRPVEAPSFAGADAEPERFSDDRDWMPRIVLLAKSTYVWLDQLSRRYGRDIRTLDAIPDEELDTLARRGITGLWLIGLWQRSRASETIKRWRGNQEAVASAYSLDDYRIADDLGGDAAHAILRDRAGGPRHPPRERHGPQPHGHRFALGRSSIPERFISVGEPPFPAYTFGGENLADRRPGRDPDRGPLLGRQRRGRRLRAARPGDRRAALRLPRQRRHELPVERHRPARLPPGRRPRGRDPDDPRGRPALPGDPLRRGDGPREEAHRAAVVAGAGPRRRDPLAQRARDVEGGVRAPHAPRVLARGRRPGRRGGARHAAAGRGVLAPRGLLRPDARHAPRLQQRVHAHAPRRGQRRLPEGHPRHRRVRPRDPRSAT